MSNVLYTEYSTSKNKIINKYIFLLPSGESWENGNG